MNRHAIILTAAALLAGALPAGASATTPRARIANPGHFAARVASCPKPLDACGGSVEFNGMIFHFAGGAMTGRVASSGHVGHGAMTFGTASTDPAVDGPLQLTFRPVAAAGVKGAFAIGDTPRGAADANGLDFEFQTRLYIKVGGAAVGPHCTIASASAPMAARFDGMLARLFAGGDAGAVYDQSTGETASRAHVTMPAARNCNGMEQTINQEIGIPGPGSVALNLDFHPVVQSDRYRAHHRHRTGHHDVAPKAPTSPAPAPPSPDTLSLTIDGGELAITVSDTQPLMDELGIYAMSPGQQCPATHEAALAQMHSGQSMPIFDAQSIAALLDSPSVAAVKTTITRFVDPDPGQTLCGVLYLPAGVGASRTLAVASTTA